MAGVQLGTEFVAFLTGDVEVKHEVFHVETELGQCFLHEREDSTAATDALDDLAKWAFERLEVLWRERSDPTSEFDQLAR